MNEHAYYHKLRNVTLDDIEFENGAIVKVFGQRYQYMSGYRLVALVAGLGKLLQEQVRNEQT